MSFKRIRRLVRAARRLARTFASAWRRGLAGLSYAGIDLTGARLGPRVFISATDGGKITAAHCSIEDGARLYAKHGRLEIGRNTYIGHGTIIVSIEQIQIGRDCLIAEYCSIRDSNHGTEPGTPYRLQANVSAPIVIGDNVWIGARVCILPGITIGDSAVVGAGAVVTKDVPPGAKVAGVPARTIQPRDPSAARPS